MHPNEKIQFKRKIEVSVIVRNLMEFSPLITCFNLIVDSADIEISKEVAKVVLFGILMLYVCSYAKDVVQKWKLKASHNSKEKASRRNLQKMSKEQ